MAVKKTKKKKIVIKKTGTYQGKSNAPGGGGRFAQLVDRGMSPALAAWIGRKKYGKEKMAKFSAQGRKRAQKRKVINKTKGKTKKK